MPRMVLGPKGQEYRTEKTSPEANTVISDYMLTADYMN